MSEQKKHKKVSLPPLTPEQQAAVLAQIEKTRADAKAERERIELYGKNVEKMSHKQFRGELVRTIKREHAGRPPACSRLIVRMSSPRSCLCDIFSTFLP